MSGATANPFDLTPALLGNVLSSFTSGHRVNDEALCWLAQLKDPLGLNGTRQQTAGKPLPGTNNNNCFSLKMLNAEPGE